MKCDVMWKCWNITVYDKAKEQKWWCRPGPGLSPSTFLSFFPFAFSKVNSKPDHHCLDILFSLWTVGESHTLCLSCFHSAHDPSNPIISYVQQMGHMPIYQICYTLSSNSMWGATYIFTNFFNNWFVYIYMHHAYQLSVGCVFKHSTIFVLVYIYQWLLTSPQLLYGFVG